MQVADILMTASDRFRRQNQDGLVNHVSVLYLLQYRLRQKNPLFQYGSDQYPILWRVDV
jgi:hypothetical protein